MTATYCSSESQRSSWRFQVLMTAIQLGFWKGDHSFWPFVEQREKHQSVRQSHQKNGHRAEDFSRQKSIKMPIWWVTKYLFRRLDRITPNLKSFDSPMDFRANQGLEHCDFKRLQDEVLFLEKNQQGFYSECSPTSGLQGVPKPMTIVG